MFNIGSSVVTKVPLWWGNVDNGGGYSCGKWAKGIWEISIPSLQFCCELSYSKSINLQRLKFFKSLCLFTQWQCCVRLHPSSSFPRAAYQLSSNPNQILVPNSFFVFFCLCLSLCVCTWFCSGISVLLTIRNNFPFSLLFKKLIQSQTPVDYL